ncbi:hypothetical protein HPP92_017842 [Vanilla planifolia]|uniref:Endonuclease/exonuclease/phosphatase domain-containing protein n=1 Tax=Vanilla planifolia TaxID=51239 RepID=A0A835QA12_VANPL|nr:hypothetical protein HPP92_017842 [Vanilla planifolia]
MFILRRLCSFLRRTFRRQPNAPVIIRQLATTTTTDKYSSLPLIRIATFDVAMFSMAPAAPNAAHTFPAPAKIDYPKSILKRNPIFSTSKRRSVSINLPGEQITVEKSRHLGSAAYRELHQNENGKSPALAELGFVDKRRKSEKSVLQVLLEVGADVFALQNVKAEEEKGMRPLADLAEGLGMKYVFAESWAPQFGNAILSKWPVKKSTVLKICDGNVLKVSIQVPSAGEVSLYCTHLDHLNEEWRMKQISAILRSSNGHHILVGCLNALDKTDYSEDRWNDVVKYSEQSGKPRPKTELMRFLKGKRYIDAKDYAGECEAVVVIPKGQGHPYFDNF